MIYGCATDNSTDNKDSLRADHPQIHICDHLQCSGNCPGHTKTTQGFPQTSQGGPGWGLRILRMLADGV